MGHLASQLRSLTLPLALAALALPGAAQANGFALDIQGLFSNGTATAGAASAHDPAGQFANPAVLASLAGTQVVAGGMVIAPRAPYTDGGSTLLTGTGADLGTPGANGDGGKTGASPWLFASQRLSPDLALGFSFYAPFGTRTDYGKGSNFYGRYQGVESTIESIAFGPALAWRATDRVALGVSAAARRDRAIIGQAFDLGSMCAGTPGCTGFAPGTSDGYGRFEANGWGWTATAGLTVDPLPGTQLGAAYRHESTSKVKGHMSFDALSRAFFTGAGATIDGDPGATLKLPLPDFLTVSASQRLGDSLQLLAAFQYTFWSRFDELSLEPTDPANGIGPLASKQGFRNAFRLSGAAVYTVRRGLDLFGGVAFEQSPITTRYRQVTLPERDSLLAGAGLEAAVWRGLSAGACYQRVQMLGTSRIDQTDAFGSRVHGSVKGSANVGVLQLAWRG
jgi:long-chain fatty acid transport protein